MTLLQQDKPAAKPADNDGFNELQAVRWPAGGNNVLPLGYWRSVWRRR